MRPELPLNVGVSSNRYTLQSGRSGAISRKALLDPDLTAPLRPAAVTVQATADVAPIVAFITVASPVQRILTRLGEPAKPPRIAPARGPPAWGDLLEPLPDWDTLAQPAPELEFDQRLFW